MANIEQVNILKQGVDTWNKWRIENPKQEIDLSFFSFNKDEFQLSAPNLFCRVKQGPDDNTYIVIDLTGIDLHEANLTESSMAGGLLIKANLQKAKFSSAHLWYTEFTDSNLSGARFTAAMLKDANLSGADLHDASLKYADLRNSKLVSTNLRSTWMLRADLSNADLTYADLSDAHLFETNLAYSKLEGTNFSGTNLAKAVFFENDLSKTIGLNQVNHLGPSLVSNSVFARSKGAVPRNFLRGIGLSDAEAEFVKLFEPGLDEKEAKSILNRIYQLYISKSLNYYSCFISYSSKDKIFAQKIHDDLQESGIRCWFDSEDFGTGESLRPTIDKAIQTRDKLLVIISKNSLNSEWVGDEVEAALEEEEISERVIVFPIRIDDSVISKRKDWGAKIRRRRYIRDFSEWEDPNKYSSQLSKLIGDLSKREKGN